MNKNSCIHARCTNEQKQKIEMRAQKANMTPSEYIVKSALNSRTRISSVGKDMARTITQLQVSINNLNVESKKIQNTGNMYVGNMERAIEAAQEGLDELWRLLK